MLINLDKHQFGVGFTLATVYILYNYISNILRTLSQAVILVNSYTAKLFMWSKMLTCIFYSLLPLTMKLNMSSSVGFK